MKRMIGAIVLVLAVTSVASAQTYVTGSTSKNLETLDFVVADERTFSTAWRISNDDMDFWNVGFGGRASTIH